MPSITQHFINQASLVLLDKEKAIKLALTCLLARGHLLIEDIPGVGKTTLAHTLATLLGLDFQRIQFTSDLLPADILGGTIFDREKNNFEFHPGAIFSNIILADEINRATPKTQSALLEAMEEGQVTLDKVTHPLASPFFVIATQNPSQQTGTFPLPESQLDRFLMRISIGYPSSLAEQQLLEGTNPREKLKQMSAAIEPASLLELQQQASLIHAAKPLIAYVQALLEFSRNSDAFYQGLSPRAGIGLIQSAKAWALIDGRKDVYPEDIQVVFEAVVSHRLAANQQIQTANSLAELLLSEVAIP